MKKIHSSALAASAWIFALLSVAPLPGLTQDAEALAASENLLETLNMEAVMKDSIEASLESQMAQFEQMGLSGEGIKELKAEMLDFMNDVMNYESIKLDLVKIYANAFSADELKELADFYKTPIGIKAINLMPRLMVEGMELGQSRVQARAPELQERLTPIFEKYLPGE